MGTQRDRLLQDARDLLGRLEDAPPGSEEHQASLSLDTFIQTIEARPDEAGLHQAARLLGHFVVDQGDWSGDYIREMTELLARADWLCEGVKRK